MAKQKTGVEKEVKTLIKELFASLGIEASAKVKLVDQEGSEEKEIYLEIAAPEETGLLIGAHGSTLNAIQSFIAMSLKQKTGDWYRVVVEIGDWRKKQEEYLVGLAKQAAERARLTGEPQNLYNLKPSQRRIIHLSLSKEEGIETESQGEGESRYLIVKPK